MPTKKDTKYVLEVFFVSEKQKMTKLLQAIQVHTCLIVTHILIQN